MTQIPVVQQGSTSSTGVNTSAFWERLWRMSGINFVVFFIIAYVIYGYQPQVGASADALVAFYDGDRTRILIAAVVSGMAVLNLLWFAAALRYRCRPFLTAVDNARTTSGLLSEQGLPSWRAQRTAVEDTI